MQQNIFSMLLILKILGKVSQSKLDWLFKSKNADDKYMPALKYVKLQQVYANFKICKVIRDTLSLSPILGSSYFQKKNTLNRNCLSYDSSSPIILLIVTKYDLRSDIWHLRFNNSNHTFLPRCMLPKNFNPNNKISRKFDSLLLNIVVASMPLSCTLLFGNM